MKCFFSIALLLLISCRAQDLSLVINKFETDDMSKSIYYSICEFYKKDSELSYDFYIKKYNEKEPLPRLFEYDTIVANIKKFNCDKEAYHNLISNHKKYINDERKFQYLRDYLENYYIRVESD